MAEKENETMKVGLVKGIITIGQLIVIEVVIVQFAITTDRGALAARCFFPLYGRNLDGISGNFHGFGGLLNPLLCFR